MFQNKKVQIEERNIPSLIREGKDREVITWFYKTIFPKVKRYIVSHGGIADDASDVFQDAILYMYNKIMQYEYDEAKYMAGGFLFRLSINRWLNKLKKDKRNMSIDNVDDSFLGSIQQEEERKVKNVNDHGHILKKVFATLGEKCLELLEHTIYYDMYMEDIAARLGFSSVGAAKMQLKRCKEKLNQEIENDPALKERLMHELYK